PATTDIYTLSLHDALPIFPSHARSRREVVEIFRVELINLSENAGGTENAETILLLADHSKVFPAHSIVQSHMRRNVKAVLQVERSEEHTSELQSRGHLVCR